MSKKMKAYIILCAALLLTFAANISAALACSVMHFQPDVPENLTNKYC
jgi:cyclic lactone autoinducer peptide